MKKFTVLILVCTVSSLFAADLRITPYYRITVPDGWVQISGETAEYLRTEKNYSDHIPANTKYDYLYQRKADTSLFSFPCIIVQVHEGKRLTEQELRSFDSKLFSYDPGTYSLWGERDSVLEVIIATEQGTVNVSCYARKEEFAKYKEEFRTVVRSIEPGNDLRYDKNMLKDLPIVREIAYGTVSYPRMLVMMVIVVIVVQKMKRKRNAV